jgi:hypothetical protein
MTEFVCPLLGFMEFLHNDWLRQILTWQRPSGCFGTMPKSSLVEEPPSDYDYEVNIPAQEIHNHSRVRRGFDLPKNREMQTEREAYYQKIRPIHYPRMTSHWSKRKLMEEKVLNGESRVL